MPGGRIPIEQLRNACFDIPAWPKRAAAQSLGEARVYGNRGGEGVVN